MSKIKTLHINNFKFFGSEKPLEINGKHLLIYGENGSGKSTIYWALYTLLECASKTNISDIEKYFRRGEVETSSLVNIYATKNTNGDFNSFVETELDNGVKYRISLIETSILENEKAKLSNLVSDFINYRLLYKAYDFAHSKDTDLYPLFEREVLPYVNFSPIEIGLDAAGSKIFETRASKILNILLSPAAGPPRVENRNGTNIIAPKHTTLYKEYLAKLRAYNNDLEALLIHINIQGNEILQNDFGYKNFRFQLELKQKADIDKKDKWFEPKYPQIALSIPEYNGVSGIIHRPQSFLNEAKLSALALAIRLAVLDRNYDSSAELKLLVLDDLLLSLDMQNRDRVIEFLLEKYVPKYQIFLLTHDFHFYEIAKNRIKLKKQHEEWLKWEMYADEPSGSQPRPIFLVNGSYIENAEKYISQRDFAVAGNYLRKEAESFLKAFLPKRRQLTNDFTELNLNGKIVQATLFCKENQLINNTHRLIDLLDEHRRFIFNPLSHDSYDVSKLENDVRRAVDTLKSLNKIESKTVLKVGDKLWFELRCAVGDLHRFDIELCDELKLISEPGIAPKLARCPFFVKYKKNGVKSPGFQEHKDLEKFYIEKFNKSDKTTSPDLLENMKLSDGTLLNTL